MLGLRKMCGVFGILALLLFGAQGVSSAACVDPAFLSVIHGPGNTIKSTVQSPDQNAWSGWVTVSFQVNGQDYTFSHAVDAPAGGSTASYRLFFSDSVTVFSYEACTDKNGMSESPEPVAVAELPD